MHFETFQLDNPPAYASVSRFRGSGGVEEIHLIVRPTDYASVETQLERLSRAYDKVLESLGIAPGTAVFRRLFCSDVHNQAGALAASSISRTNDPANPCAVSWVGQAPMPPARVSLWAYHLIDPKRGLEKTQAGPHFTLARGELAHHWTTGLTHSKAVGSYDQTRGILDHYNGLLAERRMTMADNVLRTWFFVNNIDANYQGLVVARREFFARNGLTPETHFIASSGIEGANADVAASVALDSYAISGVRPAQIEYLQALEHLSPTHIYGVTFERATSVAYRDRKHVYLSGTASIDHQGNILHPGDVSRQLDRTLENVEALLAHAGATLKDMAVFIVYVRDPADHALARLRMRDRVGDAPVEVVVAPVCRPGWLIEIEGVAVIRADNVNLPAI